MSAFNLATARISVDAEVVKAALPFAASKDIRWYLNGIYIKPAKQGGALIIATDGHMLVCLRDESATADKPCILPLQHTDARQMKKGHRLAVGGANRPWVCTKEGVPTWISPTLETEGKYPDLSDLLGDPSVYREGLLGTFNPHLIERIRKAARGKYPMVRFYHRIDPTPDGDTTAPNRAGMFTLGKHGFGLIMPMRADHDDPALELASVIPSEFAKAA